MVLDIAYTEKTHLEKMTTDNRVSLFRFVLVLILKLTLHTGRLALTLNLFDGDEDVNYAGLAIGYVACHLLMLVLGCSFINFVRLTKIARPK